jgi:hypothetical protein
MFFSSINLDFSLNHYQIFNPEDKMAIEAHRYINQLMQEYRRYHQSIPIEPESIFKNIIDVLNHKDFQKNTRAYLQQWEKTRESQEEQHKDQKLAFDFFKQHYKF